MKCPICKESVTLEGNPARPFCSDRCRLLDLDGWLQERYRVPLDEDNFEYNESLEIPDSL